MIDIQIYRDSYHIAQQSIVELSSVKPYKVAQLVQKLIHNRLIESPYQANTGDFHPESAFVELSKHLKLSTADHDAVLLAFHLVQAQSRY